MFLIIIIEEDNIFMKYLKRFNNTSEYEAFKGGEDFITPNISYVEETEGLVFKPETKPVIHPSNEIWYTTTDNEIYNFSTAASIIYNSYDDKGILCIDSKDIDEIHSIDDYFLHDDDVKRLLSIELPLITDSIGDQAFAGCSSLSYISMPGVISIDLSAFYNCGFNEITIPSIVDSIGAYAFMDCINLSTVKFEGKVNNILTVDEIDIFYGCPITKIIVPKDLIDYYKELLPEYSNLIIGQ